VKDVNRYIENLEEETESKHLRLLQEEPAVTNEEDT